MQKEFRLIITGTWTFNDEALFYTTINSALSNYPKDKYKIIIVSDCVEGPGSMAIKYAKDHDYEIKKFPAEWDKLGKSAGVRRNLQMAQYASDIHHQGLLVAFWNGESPGTKNMIEVAKRYNLPVQIVDCKVTEKVIERVTDP